MLNYKIILAFAVFALIISILAGIVGAIPFGIILLRAILGIIIFSGLGAGVGYVIQSFLPGLLETEPETGGGVETAEGESQEGVDIVIPEENPHTAYEDQEGSLSENSAATNSSGNDEYTSGETDDMSESGEEKEEEKEEEEEKGEEEGKAEEREVEFTENTDDDVFSNIDDMPGLDSMEGSFVSINRSNTDSTSSREAGNVSINGQKQDPAKAAQAIKTWLGKDKEG